MNNTKLFTVSFLATLLVISSVPLYLYLKTPESSDQIALNKFSSYEELKTFLETASSLPNNYWVRGGEPMAESSDAQVAVPAPAEAADTDYSKTNIQVEGVDEADIVKTDGEYIYIVSGGNITIIKAYPPQEAKVLSKISLEGGITGIFINGDKLAVFETEYGIYPLYEGEVVYDSSSSSEEVKEPTADDEATSSSEPRNGSTTEEPPRVPVPIVYEPPTTSIKVYDISDRGNPVLKRNFSVDGNYFSSRMIGDYVYVVATQWAVFIETDVFLPRVHSDNETDRRHLLLQLLRQFLQLHQHRCPEHTERRPRTNPPNNTAGRHQHHIRFTEQHLPDLPQLHMARKRNHENNSPTNQDKQTNHNLCSTRRSPRLHP